MKLSAGPINRSTKKQRQYNSHLQSHPSNGECNFCKFNTDNNDEVVVSHEFFYVTINAFGYDLWDGYTVKEHLMIVPKRHMTSLSELSPEEYREWFNIMSRYEKNGYSVYSRSPSDKTKSVAHQHTHLIKLTDRKNSVLLYIRKPHILLKK